MCSYKMHLFLTFSAALGNMSKLYFLTFSAALGIARTSSALRSLARKLHSLARKLARLGIIQVNLASALALHKRSFSTDVWLRLGIAQASLASALALHKRSYALNRRRHTGEHLGRRGVNPALEIHKHVIHVEIKYRLFHNRRIKIIT